MFLSQYRHSIDTKGRLTIPANFRDLMTDGAYVTQGFDGNLRVLTAESFELLYDQVSKMSFTNPTVRRLSRLLFSTAAQVEPDKNGRILIPQFLRAAAGLDGEAIVVGAGKYFEIWAPERWEAQATRLSAEDLNVEEFSSLDLSSG